MPPDTVDVIVPVRNEEANVDEFYRRVAALGLAEALIVVDNASTDDTVARLARHRGLRVIRHATDEGYGASIRHGAAAGRARAIVIIDADLEYPPEVIPALVAALDEHPVVYGSRFLGARPPDMSALRRLGNRIVTALFNRLYGQRATDLYTGIKALRRDAVPLSRLRRNGFEHVVELAALITAAGQRIHEVAVDYRPRTHGASKMRHVPETVKLIAYLVAYRLRPPRPYD